MSDEIEEFFDRVGTGHIDNKTEIAIFDFMGYLTTRSSETRVGAAYNPTPLLNHYKDWKRSRGQGENTSSAINVDNW